MAAVTASLKSVYGFETPSGPKTLPTFAGAPHLYTCFFACSFIGTYVQSTGYTLSVASDLVSEINKARRSGGTITIIDVAAAMPGIEGASAVVMPGPVTFALAGSAATGLLYGPDNATEHAAAVMSAFTEVCSFVVTFADSSS